MKLSDKDIQEAFKSASAPPPSDSSKKRIIRRAVDEFERRQKTVEKKSKGFASLFRPIGNFFLNLTGGPLGKAVATIGVAVLAVGLFLTVGPDGTLVNQENSKVKQEDQMKKPEQGTALEDLQEVPTMTRETAQSSIDREKPQQVFERKDQPPHIADIFQGEKQELDKTLQEFAYRTEPSKAPASAAPPPGEPSAEEYAGAPGRVIGKTSIGTGFAAAYGNEGNFACFGGASYPQSWRDEAACTEYGCYFGKKESLEECLQLGSRKGAREVVYGVQGERMNECWLQNSCEDKRADASFSWFSIPKSVKKPDTP